MPTIRLLGFRGTGGFKNPKYQFEPALIKAGHVGFQFEGDPKIYGFHPIENSTSGIQNENQILELLKEHIRQPGCVQDDTAIFERAIELFELGERTEVVYLTYNFSDKDFDFICKTAYSWYEEKKIFWYNFPTTEGMFDEGEYNCAIFPILLGIPLPTTDGNLAVYIQAMKLKGAQQWGAES